MFYNKVLLKVAKRAFNKLRAYKNQQEKFRNYNEKIILQKKLQILYKFAIYTRKMKKLKKQS